MQGGQITYLELQTQNTGLLENVFQRWNAISSLPDYQNRCVWSLTNFVWSTTW